MNQLIDIPQAAPFTNCKLGRESYAKVLTDIVRTNSEGFVLAIDNKWGAGKTTFVSMWSQMLQNEGFQTLYFNAWENDFENNPFVAITAELKELLKNDHSETFKEVLKKGSKISKAVIPSVMKAFLKRYAGEEVAEIMEKYSEGVLEAFQEDIDSYVERKKNIKEFHEDLENYISQNSNGKPIVFIIDELDRCRPDYAVSVLENVKHLFSVKGIVFVLAIDKEQLGHAICGAYGSNNIDSKEYLRRFIDVEYSLPRPDAKTYMKHLYDGLGFDDFFELPDRKKNGRIYIEKRNFIDILGFLFEQFEPTLRQQEKIMYHIRLSFKSFKWNNYTVPELLPYLVIVRVFNPNLYFNIRHCKLTYDELLEANARFLKLKKLIPEDELDFVILLEAMLLVMYENYLDRKGSLKLREIESLKESNLKSQFDKSEDQYVFYQYVVQTASDFDLGRAPIDFLLKKIDLTDSFQQ